MRLIAAVLFAPTLAAAQPFVEVGIGAETGGCMYQGFRSEVVANRIHTDINCSRSPLGLFAVGYQFNDQWRIQLDHWSSLPDTKDRGMEIISIRYRYTFR